MNNKILAICDSEATYADLLTRQLLRMQGNRIEIRKFNGLDKLKEFASQNLITYLLLSQDYEKHIYDIDALSYYVLTNSKVPEDINNSGTEYLHRYQGVNEIYERISGINTRDKEISKERKEEKEFQLIGTYNPVRRNGQTTFSRALATELGRRKKKVLYINLDEISVGIDQLRDSEGIIDGKGNISDIIYYLKQSPERLEEILKRTVFQGRRFDVIAPAPIFTETQSIQLEEWLKLIRLLEDSLYDVVILDVDSKVQGYLDILDRCNKVYIPELEGQMSREKLECFSKALRIIGKNKLLIKMESIVVPKYESDIDSQLAMYIKNKEII